jgi:hypothetical protein
MQVAPTLVVDNLEVSTDDMAIGVSHWNVMFHMFTELLSPAQALEWVVES